MSPLANTFSAQVIYPLRDGDYLFLSACIFPLVLLRVFGLFKLYFYPTLFSQRAPDIWCEMWGDIVLSEISQISRQPKRGQARCGACRWSTSFCSCLVVTGPALNGRSQWRTSDRPNPPSSPWVCVHMCVYNAVQKPPCVLWSLIGTWNLSGPWMTLFPCNFNDSFCYIQ